MIVNSGLTADITRLKATELGVTGPTSSSFTIGLSAYGTLFFLDRNNVRYRANQPMST